MQNINLNQSTNCVCSFPSDKLSNEKTKGGKKGFIIMFSQTWMQSEFYYTIKQMRHICLFNICWDLFCALLQISIWWGGQTLEAPG